MADLFKLIENNGLVLHGDIEYFAELVRQDEREACAKLCECEYKIRLAETIRARNKK